MPDDSIDSLEIPEQARRAWREAMTVERDLRSEFAKRMRFRAGDQWEDSHKAQRGRDRPAIVVNLLEQPIQQVINQNLRAHPGGQVSPADENANPKVAEYLQGRIRHIEYESNAQVALANCVSYLASGGIGFLGLTVDYVSFDSMDQEPRIRVIEDPACWAIDPAAKESDGRDARWAVGRQKYSVEEFKRRWPDAAVVDASFLGEDQTYDDWFDIGEDGYHQVWVGEYWRLTYKDRELQRYSNGASGFPDDKNFVRSLPPDVFPLSGDHNRRMVQFPKVTQYLVSGVEVLDKTPWIGTRIPIYKVIASQFYAEGRHVVKSLISDALASQQTYNCSESLKLEAVVMAPKPKWVVTQEQIAGHEKQWKEANTSSDAALFYNGLVDSRGNPVPPPDWKVFVPPVQEFMMVSGGAKEDIKATTGFFDPALGNLDTSRHSGKAIMALQQQTGSGTLHYAEALAQTLKAVYQDIIDLDMKLRGSKAQSVRTINADGKHQLVRVNDPAAAMPLATTQGRYGVTVSVGPSEKDQREATSDFIDTVASNDPQGWALIRDIGARLKEPQLGHYADEIATRWTPPQFAQQDPNQPPLPPQVQQQLSMLPQLTQKVHELSQVIAQKQVEEKGKFDREMAVENQKMQIEELKAATQIRVAELNGKNEQLLSMMDARVRELEAMSDHRRTMVEQAHRQAHEHGLQKEDHEHEQQQGELERQAAADLAATQAAQSVNGSASSGAE